MRTHARWSADDLRPRRLAAALCAALAVVAAVAALRPHAPPSRSIWVAARDLSGGAPLATADAVVRRLPLTAIPSGAMPSTAAVLGRLVAAPMRAGEPITDVRLLDTALLDALRRPGLVAVPVRLVDGSAAAAVVRAGDLIDVLATADTADGQPASDTTVIVEGVTVLAVPPNNASGDPAGLVVVAATRAQAASLAHAASTARLSIVLRRPP